MTTHKPIYAIASASILTAALSGCADFRPSRTDTRTADSNITAQVEAQLNQEPSLGPPGSIAVQEVDGGHPDAAAARLEALLTRWHGKLRPADELLLSADLAFAYYRVGEQANCGPGIDTATCIVPIDPASIQFNHALVAAPDVEDEGESAVLLLKA